MRGGQIHYFMSGNTAQGYQSLLSSNVEGLAKIYLVPDEQEGFASLVIQRIGDKFCGMGLDTELLHGLSDHSEIMGVIARKLGIGVFGQNRFMVELGVAAAKKMNVLFIDAESSANCGIDWNKANMVSSDRAVCRQRVSQCFEEALHIHDEWEKIYISRMDSDASQRVADEWIPLVFGDRREEGEGKAMYRFLGGASPMGAVDFIPNITRRMIRRLFIKGRPGTGKSTLLKKIIHAGIKRGLDVEVYHCGFDCNSIDMAVFRSIGVALLDSTAPHEYFPNRDGDSVIDMYALCVEPGTDERFASEIGDLSERYREKIKEGTGWLYKAMEIWRAETAAYAYINEQELQETLEEAWRFVVERIEAECGWHTSQEGEVTIQ